MSLSPEGEVAQRLREIRYLRDRGQPVGDQQMQKFLESVERLVEYTSVQRESVSRLNERLDDITFEVTRLAGTKPA